MKLQKASIIIPTFNKRQRLVLTLEAFNNQNISLDSFEVIIIDDGSTDGTKEMLENFKSKYYLQYAYQKNQGRSVARNTGIQMSKGDIIIFCDDDLIVENNFVEEHLKEHATNPNCVVHGRIYNLSYLKFFKDPISGELYPGLESEKISKEFIQQYLLTKEDLISLDRVRKQKKLTFFEKLIYSTFENEKVDFQWLSFTGGNVSCSKKLLIEAGLFDESFGKKWGCEDLELGYRLHQMGISFIYSLKACNYHLAHYRMTYQEELDESINKFYLKHSDPRIGSISKLINGEFKEIEQYIAHLNDL